MEKRDDVMAKVNRIFSESSTTFGMFLASGYEPVSRIRFGNTHISLIRDANLMREDENELELLTLQIDDAVFNISVSREALRGKMGDSVTWEAEFEMVRMSVVPLRKPEGCNFHMILKGPGCEKIVECFMNEATYESLVEWFNARAVLFVVDESFEPSNEGKTILSSIPSKEILEELLQRYNVQLVKICIGELGKNLREEIRKSQEEE